jgi:hypothetical protein
MGRARNRAEFFFISLRGVRRAPWRTSSGHLGISVRAVFPVRNDERRNNLLEGLAPPSREGTLIHDQFSATTWDDLLADPLGAIYLHIGDYAAATSATI